MEIHSHVITSAPLPSATIVMLRDGPQGLEVFMVRRHADSSVLGGAYVFPGGKLDEADATLDPVRLLDRPPAHLRAALGEEETDAGTAAALHVAAVREAYEESGVLFATDAQGRVAQPDRLPVPGAEGFGPWLAANGLRLATGDIQPWSRWITPRVPSVSHKRFDTRFFVARVPDGQDPRHDDVEATHSEWLTPAMAFDRFRAGQIDLAPPQIMSLVHLHQHRDVDSVMAEARGRRPPCVQPEPFDEDGTRVICYPGDERHPIRERAFPGPTRLRFRNKRFEAVAGYGALPGD